MKELILLVLAGGLGSRFAPFTTDKILFPFLEKPLAEYTFLRVIPKEVTKIVVITNAQNDAYFKSLKLDRPIETCLQVEARGMADAILTAKNNIQDAEILILIADDLFDSSLPQKIVDKARSSDAFAVIPGREVQNYFPGGYLVIGGGEKVTEIIEKPGEGNEPSNIITISGHYFKDSSVLLQKLANTTSTKDDCYERAISALMKEYNCIVYNYDGAFVSLKYSWNVLDIMSQLLKQVKTFRGENITIKDNVLLEGEIYIGNNVKIFENSKISGPVYIGDNSIIGNNNVIRSSMIGQGCVTGFSSDITRSYIGQDCWFHNNYIGDSVLEGNVSLGSGSVLANLRLDEQMIMSNVKSERISAKRNKLGAMIAKNVRIGVNASVMPGVKIGTGCLIGAGLCLAQDIGSEQFVYQKTELIIEKNRHLATQDRSEFKEKI